MTPAEHRRHTPLASPIRTLRLLLGIAIAVSIVHYVDNVANYDAYPQPTSGPSPPRELIAVSWFVFTAFGLAAYALLKRARVKAAAVCLAVYSISGLVGLGHYSVDGATDMVWWRQLHIVADIVCGVAILAFAARLVHRRRAPAAT